MWLKRGVMCFILFVVFISFNIARCKICYGSYDIRNSIANFNKIKDCTIITGSLQILLIYHDNEFRDYIAILKMDDVVLPKLQVIGGYLLLYRVFGLSSVGRLLPNLRMIRGIFLFRQYALIIYDQEELEEIGTDKLFYIARGYVKITKAPKLCYADTINWNRIGNNTYLHLQQLKENCPACPERCNGHCWNQAKCQVFSDNCDVECLGCTKNYSSAYCEVCKNYENNGICVAQCPPDKYILRTMNICVTKEECHLRNFNKSKKDANKNWWIHDTECRSDCPVGTEYIAEKNTCISCGNRCVRYCVATELNNQNAIQNLYGCTHINGSITINGLKTSEDLNSLYENLYSIRVIKGYLLLSRNEIIEDLEFLPNLTSIEGRELTSKKALFVYENRNLKKLWNLDEHFSLQIKNGRIGFHDNEQLCLREIQKFANKFNINYTDTDVSLYSNGAFCVTPAAEDLIINVTQINTSNVTLIWEQKNPNDEVYYTVYYTDTENDTENSNTQDSCSSSGWETMSTANNSAQLLNLKVFTTYYFYIRINLKNTQSVKTSIREFTTLPDDPESPTSFSAHPIDHESIKLVWTKPLYINGILSHYFINIYLEDNYDIAFKRNYCEHPHSTKGALIDKTEELNMKEVISARIKMYGLEVPEKTYPEPPCNPTVEEINIKLWENFWLYLCDKNSQSKFGFDACKNYYYDRFNESDIQIQKRSSEITSSRKKSSLDFVKGKSFTVTADANVTNITINKLQPFSIYVFYLIACNKEVDQRKLCSPVLQASARTLKTPKADNITDDVQVTVNKNDVVVMWSPPKKPNSFIVSYTILYLRDLEHSQNTTICIPHEVYRREKRYTLKNMSPGSYYLMVRAVSLAGPGDFTKRKYFEIENPATNSFWLIFFTVLLLLLGLVSIVVFFIIKRKRSLERIQLIANINPDYAGITYMEDEWEMDRNDVQLQKIAGQGTFGVVHLALLKKKNIVCAVKTVNENATIQERISFLKEASIMKQFSNGHHVVKLFGVVSRGQPPLVIMELMERGDLKQYLRSLRDSSQNFTSNEIYRMAIEIADGLSYLTSRKYVHRDLAARNCMVATDRTVKIGDFGMTRDVYETDYYKKGTRGMLPVRWMPPESIADGVFTSDSDIWSYGIVLWEIATLAEQPYQGLANEQVLQYVVSKGTLTRPTECPNLLWDIMRRCWDWYPSNRPTCFEVIEKLQDHVGQDFKLISYYHSREGQEFLITHGSVRPNNPPALGTGGFQHEDISSENDPLHDGHRDHLNEPEFLPPSSPQQGSRLSGHFH